MNVSFTKLEEVLIWLENQCAQPLDPNRTRTYCGNADPIPQGYIRRGTPYECLRKGIKTGICNVRTKMR